MLMSKNAAHVGMALPTTYNDSKSWSNPVLMTQLSVLK